MNFRSKIWPRHSLRQPRFLIRQMHFHYWVTFTGYIRCFCATTSHDLVTLTWSLFCCVNNVGGQHRWLFAFLAACYELTLILCSSCLILLLFVANKFLLLLLYTCKLYGISKPILRTIFNNIYDIHTLISKSQTDGMVSKTVLRSYIKN